MFLTVESRKPNTYERASFLSRLTFMWVRSLVWHARHSKVTGADLFESLPSLRVPHVSEAILAAWLAEVEVSKRRNSLPSLARVLRRLYGKEYLTYGLIYGILECSVWTCKQISIDAVLRYFAMEDKSKPRALVHACILALCCILHFLFCRILLFKCFLTASKLRSACATLIYDRILKNSKEKMLGQNPGEAIHLISKLESSDVAMFSSNYLWIVPLQLVVLWYLISKMYEFIDWQALAFSSGLLIVTLIISNLLIFCIEGDNSENRSVHLIAEVIAGFKTVKMFNWEPVFEKMILKLRRKELIINIAWLCVKALFTATVRVLPTIYLCWVLYKMIQVNALLESSKIYVIVYCLYVLRVLLNTVLPLSLQNALNVLIVMKQMRMFLSRDEGVATQNYIKKRVLGQGYKPSILFTDVEAIKQDPEDVSHLKKVSFFIPPSQLVGILGFKQSGKSALFDVILGDLMLRAGTAEITGNLSYAQSSPWIFQDSVKKNIVFGEPYDEKKYKNIVKMCLLNDDIQRLPAGDDTVIGEGNFELTIDQKLRIALARAIYRDADIYLFDGVFDTLMEGKDLFESCIVWYLRNKVVVVATTEMVILEKTQKIMVMEDGKVLGFDDFLTLQDLIHGLLKNKNPMSNPFEDILKIDKGKCMKFVSCETAVSTDSSKGWSSYKQLSEMGFGWFAGLLIVIILITAQVLHTLCELVLMEWVHKEETGEVKVKDKAKREEEFSKFCYYAGCSVVFEFLSSVVFYSIATNVSHNVFKGMLLRTLGAPVKLICSENACKILARFVTDISVIDNISVIFYETVKICFYVLGSCVLALYLNYWTALGVAILVGGECFVAANMAKSLRNIRVIGEKKKASVYRQLLDLIDGQSVIRASGITWKIQTKFELTLDDRQSAWFMLTGAKFYMGWLAEATSLIFILFCNYVFFFGGNPYYGASVGLLLVHIHVLQFNLAWGVSQMETLESSMISVTRSLTLISTKKEIHMKPTPYLRPSAGWPTTGKIVFQDVSVKHSRFDARRALEKINFTIEPEDKVLIVGQKRSGKSSIIAAILWLFDFDGNIFIDDYNTKRIGKENLRRKITSVPDEMFFFSDTIRKNLDPCDEYTEDLLFEALETVHMKNQVTKLAKSLKTHISDSGFTNNEQQLLCVARAVLRKDNKVVLFDDIGKNVDKATEDLINRIIETCFESKTVLFNVSKVRTKRNVDKIMLLANGKIAEFGSAQSIESNTRSKYNKLIDIHIEDYDFV